MPSVRASVLAALANGDLGAHSPLVAVRGVGPYIAARVARAFPGVVTVGELWAAARPRARVTVERTVRRAVQNARANQCVATRVGASRRKVYHTGDLNEHAYEALATLLNAAPQPTAYGALPARLPQRAPSSKACGCMTRRECAASSLCARSDDGRACVPRAHNATGFEGLPAHQRESDPRRVRAASRRVAAHRGDPDVRSDLVRRHAPRLSYDRRGATRWRRPRSRVRVPL